MTRTVFCVMILVYLCARRSKLRPLLGAEKPEEGEAEAFASLEAPNSTEQNGVSSWILTDTALGSCLQETCKITELMASDLLAPFSALII